MWSCSSHPCRVAPPSGSVAPQLLGYALHTHQPPDWRGYYTSPGTSLLGIMQFQSAHMQIKSCPSAPGLQEAALQAVLEEEILKEMQREALLRQVGGS